MARTDKLRLLISQAAGAPFHPWGVQQAAGTGWAEAAFRLLTLSNDLVRVAEPTVGYDVKAHCQKLEACCATTAALLAHCSA